MSEPANVIVKRERQSEVVSMKIDSKGLATSVLAITIGALAADLSAETEHTLALTSAAPAQPMVFFFGAERETSSVNYDAYVEQPIDALLSDVAQSVEVAANTTTVAVAKKP
ncbi:MAG: hypothetical protein ACJATP_000578, partial [Candidatus Azotimanducaceae bacterium]